MLNSEMKIIKFISLKNSNFYIHYNLNYTNYLLLYNVYIPNNNYYFNIIYYI